VFIEALYNIYECNVKLQANITGSGRINHIMHLKLLQKKNEEILKPVLILPYAAVPGRYHYCDMGGKENIDNFQLIP
jgi:hypothetical protein